MESFHAKPALSPLQDKEVEISENSDFIDDGTITQIRDASKRNIICLISFVICLIRGR
jgi:hypothetical protein